MPYRSADSPSIHALRDLIAEEDELIVARRTARIAHDDAEARLERARRDRGGLRSLLGIDKKRATATRELEQELEALVARERAIEDKLAAIDRAKVTVAELEAKRAVDLQAADGEGGDAFRDVEAAIAKTQERLATYKLALERCCSAQEDVMRVLDAAAELADRQSASGRAGGFVSALFDPLEGGDIIEAIVDSSSSVTTAESTLIETGLTAEQAVASITPVLLDVGVCADDDLPGLAARLGSRDRTAVVSAAEVANAALALASKRLNEVTSSLERELESLAARRSLLIR